MKIALWSLIVLICSLPVASAQSFSVDDLAELTGAIDQKTEGRWRLSFTAADRTLQLESRSAIEGEDFGRGTRTSAHGKYPVVIRLRITANPGEPSRQQYDELQKQRNALVEKSTDNTRTYLGYQKGAEQRLTKAEWRDCFQLLELERQLDALAPPTHTFHSLYLFDASPSHIRFELNGSKTARQLLSDRDTIFGLLTELKP